MDTEMLIESEGILYRGPSLSQPTEVWHYTRQEWVRNCFLDPVGEADFAVEIDEQRAERLKTNNLDAEHFLYYDTPPWLQTYAAGPPAAASVSNAPRDTLLPSQLTLRF